MGKPLREKGFSRSIRYSPGALDIGPKVNGPCTVFSWGRLAQQHRKLSRNVSVQAPRIPGCSGVGRVSHGGLGVGTGFGEHPAIALDYQLISLGDELSRSAHWERGLGGIEGGVAATRRPAAVVMLYVAIRFWSALGQEVMVQRRQGLVHVLDSLGTRQQIDIAHRTHSGLPHVGRRLCCDKLREFLL
jgi:hypothetical protein